jgi:GAF domain-containing protein
MSLPGSSDSSEGRLEMTQEGAAVHALVEMADTLVDDFDVVDLLTGLTDRCVDLLGVSAAGVMLVSPQGRLRLVAASSEAMRVVELFELQAQEGPCLDAYSTGERVEHEVLRARSGRWPRFATVALEAGFHSVFALPLRLRDTTIGALNLFNVEPTPMNEDDILVARAFADLATISVIQHGATTDAQRVNEQLTDALTSRVLIEQAKGVIFERAGIDMAEAFSRLRGYARSSNRRLTDVAQAAIDGTLDPRAWEPGAPPTHI